MTDMTMTCTELDERLADYLEGGLDATSRAAVEHHLAGCAQCARVLAALDDRTAAAVALPVLKPSRDLWSGVATRIESRVLPLAERAMPRMAPRRWRAAGLAAAAAVLVVGTATVTRVLTVREQPQDVAVKPVGTPDIRFAARHEALMRTYDGEIARLDSVVRLRRNDLDTTTVKIIEKNLRVIDAAIAESRAALAKDPRSRFLNDQLTRVLDQKVGLLRTVALLPTRT